MASAPDNPAHDGITLVQLLGALSRALDMVEGEVPGHSQRTAVIAQRIGAELGCDEPARQTLLYASLLKDAGCSSTGSQTAALYGSDDLAVKRDRRRTDFTDTSEALRHLYRNTPAGIGHVARVVRLAVIGQRQGRTLHTLRCDRGADIASRIGCDPEVCDGIRHANERFDGSGTPAGLGGEEISLTGRVIAVAQTLDTFTSAEGRARAREIVSERSGVWFDPAVVAALASIPDDELGPLPGDPTPPVLETAVDGRRLAGDEGLDHVAEAFALVIDAKSPYTASHSTGVAMIACGLAERIGVDGSVRRDLWRAGLLHDIGKLGVSSRILDKRGALSPAEWVEMRRHPVRSHEILGSIPAFANVARMAYQHHERLDGSGYPLGVGGDQISLASRIMQVADIAEALGTERPYRPALDRRQVLEMIGDEVARGGLDDDVVAELEPVLDSVVARVPDRWQPPAA